jgi:uncharacterized protein YggU (UPF0235/DUF167 family)
VRVQPRAARTEIVGWRADGTLSVRVAAAVTVERGTRGRDKLVKVAGLTPAEVRRRIGGSA